MAEKVQLDNHKLAYHPLEVADWLNGKNFAPIYLEIGPVDFCNHKCIFCALDYLEKTKISIDTEILINAIVDMASYGVKAIMFAGEGEPLLHHDLPKIIQVTKNNGIDVSITTNGVLLNKKKTDQILHNLSWIKVSIDAGTKETYAVMHGTKQKDFNLVLKNLAYACRVRDADKLDVSIGTQMLMLEQNVHEAEELAKKVKDAGVDYLVLKPYSQHPDSINKFNFCITEYDQKLLELSEKYSDGKFNLIYRSATVQEIESNEIQYDNCYGINFFTLIESSGNVIPCNLFYEKKEYYYGNLKDKSFQAIWEDEKRKKIVSKINSKSCSDCRIGCRLNFINKYLHDVKNKSKKHINFI